MTLVQDNSVQAINTALLSIKRDISASTATTAGTTAGLEQGKTYNINISGNAETATTAKTARTATNANHAETAETATKMSNALTVNGKTYDGSSAVDAGVQTVANGGTGATDAAGGFNALADGVRDSNTPRDDEKMLLKPSGTWYKTTCLDFWNYIKGKISSVLGLTKDNYGGKASTAGTADVANALAGRGGITNTDTFQNVMNNDGKWYIPDLNEGWSGSFYSFHAGGSQSGLMFRIRGGSTDVRNVEVNYSIDSNRFAGPWTPLIGRIPIGAPSSPKDGDIWIER